MKPKHPSPRCCDYSRSAVSSFPLPLQLLSSILHRRAFQTRGSTQDPQGCLHNAYASSAGAGEDLGPCLSHCLPSDLHTPGPGHTWSKIFFFFFSSTTLLLPTHLPPPSCTHAQPCNPMDCSPPGFSVHGLFQARILEWVAFPFSRGASQPRDQTQVSHIAGGFFTS